MSKKETTTKVPKFYRDILEFHTELQSDTPALLPAAGSPICSKCKLYANCPSNPYFLPQGSDDPLITLVTEQPSLKEDSSGVLGSAGPAKFMLDAFSKVAAEVGLSMDRIRIVPMTRCAITNNLGKADTGGRWCRHFLIDDLRRHPPKLIVPIGSGPLGWLCHKSSAQDWSGKLLTYRGWPDDFLTDEKFEHGHFLFGDRPGQEQRIPMVPIQSPRIVFGSRNPAAILRWQIHVKRAASLAVQSQPALVYDRPWWRITTDPETIAQFLLTLIENPGTVVTYDTESTGLLPYAPNQNIVFMMFRFNHPVTQQPCSLGWPWNYPESPLLDYIGDLSPFIVEALSVSKLRGHNLTFDLLFSIANIPGADQKLNQICEAFYQDSWHMRYCWRQETGSLGLELIAYDWVPSLAGYEEEMTLLIERYPELLSPGEGMGGHYAKCPAELWQSHLRPYVMGDVEVCHEACDKLEEKLKTAKTYRIPLANPNKLGSYRWYNPISREIVYKNLLSPAGSMLAKMMARGMKIDQNELSAQETLVPTRILAAKEALRQGDPRINAWCQRQEANARAAGEEWVFDLEDKKILKSIMFEVLNCPISTLTDAGAKKIPDLSMADPADLLKYASTDKFTLNNLAVSHAAVRPILEYRKLMKEYTSYIRPMRNSYYAGIDKNDRKRDQVLMRDGMIHSTFKLAGTRGGRLSSVNPNLQQIGREGVVKKLYVSRHGKERGLIYQADMSQIELRLLAMVCGDPSMVAAYRDDIDLHSLTTSRVFKIPFEHFSDEYKEWLQKNGKTDEAKKIAGKRKIGKILNFLTGYGGGALGFQSALALQGTYMELNECETYINNFFDSYPKLKEHIGIYKKFIQEHAVAVSITGRVRILEEVFGDDNSAANKALRAGYNHLIQSTASDAMLCCLITIEALMREQNLESNLICTVHDSLVVDAIWDEVPVVHEICDYVLKNVPEVMQLVLGPSFDISWCLAPFDGDGELGLSYGHQIAIPKKGPIDWDELKRDAIKLYSGAK